MPSPRTQLADRRYVARLKAQREDLGRRLAATWSRVDPYAIADSYAANVVPVAARLLTAGQASSLATTRGYMRALGVQLADPFTVPGRTEAGTAADALEGIGPTVLAAIGRGQGLEDALAWGRELLTRTGDAEFTRATDRETEGQARVTERFTGWRGITYGAVDDCVSNEGDHTFDEEMYRHANCRCERVLITAGG